MIRKPKLASAKRGSRVTVETAGGKLLLPGRRALNVVAGSDKSINDYSKSGASINDYPVKTNR